MKEWAREDDLLHVLDHLMPCSSYTFRMKCKNRCGWSPYSRASDVATTDAAPPDTPNKVFASRVTPDMVHLHWHAPRDNGARITCYGLRGKRVGGIWQGENGRKVKHILERDDSGVAGHLPRYPNT